MSGDGAAWDNDVAQSVVTTIMDQLPSFPTSIFARRSDREPSIGPTWFRFELMPDHTSAPLLPCLARSAVLSSVPPPGTRVLVRGRWLFGWKPSPSLVFWVDQLTVIRTEPSLSSPVRNTAPLGRPLTRIALIASPGSDGANDVVNALQGGILDPEFIQVAWHDADTLLKALRGAVAGNYDAIALTRGGGMDGAVLAVLNSQTVSDIISSSPVPILTGLGHVGDTTRADQAATLSFATPQELGTFIGAHSRPIPPPPSAHRGTIPLWTYVAVGLFLLIVLAAIIRH